MRDSLRSELPKLAMDDIPTPDKDAVTITGLVKDHGRISGYQLSDERIVSRSEESPSHALAESAEWGSHTTKIPNI